MKQNWHFLYGVTVAVSLLVLIVSCKSKVTSKRTTGATETLEAPLPDDVIETLPEKNGDEADNGILKDPLPSVNIPYIWPGGACTPSKAFDPYPVDFTEPSIVIGKAQKLSVIDRVVIPLEQGTVALFDATGNKTKVVQTNHDHKFQNTFLPMPDNKTIAYHRNRSIVFHSLQTFTEVSHFRFRLDETRDEFDGNFSRAAVVRNSANQSSVGIVDLSDYTIHEIPVDGYIVAGPVNSGRTSSVQFDDTDHNIVYFGTYKQTVDTPSQYLCRYFRVTVSNNVITQLISKTAATLNSCTSNLWLDVAALAIVYDNDRLPGVAPAASEPNISAKSGAPGTFTIRFADTSTIEFTGSTNAQTPVSRSSSGDLFCFSSLDVLNKDVHLYAVDLVSKSIVYQAQGDTNAEANIACSSSADGNFFYVANGAKMVEVKRADFSTKLFTGFPRRFADIVTGSGMSFVQKRGPKGQLWLLINNELEEIRRFEGETLQLGRVDGPSRCHVIAQDGTGSAAPMFSLTNVENGKVTFGSGNISTSGVISSGSPGTFRMIDWTKLVIHPYVPPVKPFLFADGYFIPNGDRGEWLRFEAAAPELIFTFPEPFPGTIFALPVANKMRFSSNTTIYYCSILSDESCVTAPNVSSNVGGEPFGRSSVSPDGLVTFDHNDAFIELNTGKRMTIQIPSASDSGNGLDKYRYSPDGKAFLLDAEGTVEPAVFLSSPVGQPLKKILELDPGYYSDFNFDASRKFVLLTATSLQAAERKFIVHNLQLGTNTVIGIDRSELLPLIANNEYGTIVFIVSDSTTGTSKLQYWRSSEPVAVTLVSGMNTERLWHYGLINTANAPLFLASNHFLVPVRDAAGEPDPMLVKIP